MLDRREEVAAARSIYRWSVNRAIRSAREVVEQCFRAFAARDADAFVELMHPDVRWEPASALFLPADQPSPTYAGHEGIRRWFEDVSGWTGYRVRTLRFDAAGEMVFVPAVATLAVGATWLTRTVYYVFTVREGRVTRLRSFVREDDARAHAGLPPARAHFADHATLGGELRIPPEPAELGRVRAVLRDAADEAGMDPAATNDMLVAVTEALSNAITHGEVPGDGTIDVTWGTEDDMLVVCVGDCGRYRAPETLDEDRLDHGRGIAVMRLLVDDMTIEPRDEGTLVRLAKRVAGPGER